MTSCSYTRVLFMLLAFFANRNIITNSAAFVSRQAFLPFIKSSSHQRPCSFVPSTSRSSNIYKTRQQRRRQLHRKAASPVYPRNNIYSKIEINSSITMSASETTSYNNNRQEQQQERKGTLARKVSISDLEQCGERLRNGDLVAFPTETVYGLGCHALDPIAINKVFQAKERPLTDPLIVHVTETSDALNLWNAGRTTDDDDSLIQLENKVLRILCDKFWPGPLTIVAKASNTVPSVVMANTGYVACRSPSNELARSLIKAADVPIAAPSANKFGHVSPTRAHHVWDDLQYEDVWIIDPALVLSPTDNDGDGEEKKEEHNSPTAGPESIKAKSHANSELSGTTAICQVGVESTVAKITISPVGGGIIEVLRQGAVSARDVENCLIENDLKQNFTVKSKINKATKDHIPTVAPGQTLRHYSPNIPSFILSVNNSHNNDNLDQVNENLKSMLSTIVIVDYGQRLVRWKSYACAYQDLSASNNSSEAAQSLFNTLRWAEQVNGANRIIFPDIVSSKDGTNNDDALTLTLKDKLTRAASGVVIDSLLL